MVYKIFPKGFLCAHAKKFLNTMLSICISINVLVAILDHRTLVATKVSRKHYLVPKGGGGEFDPQEFEQHPERYRSIFAEKVFAIYFFFQWIEIDVFMFTFLKRLFFRLHRMRQ